MVNWIMPWGQMKWLLDYNEEVARMAFDRPSSYVIGGPFPGLGVTPVKMYPSFETYISTLSSVAGTVCYDLENWEASPLEERQDPFLAIRDFQLLARRQGQTMIVTPGRDLVDTPGRKGGNRNTNEDYNDAYLRLNIPACAAMADIFLVQSQNAQKNQDTFSKLINGAKAQVPAAQPLWAGLSTAFATSTQLVTAFESVPNVQGFWLTIDSPAHANVAADFLRVVL